MKFKSALVTQASGSVGGATFAHNKGGLYIRARSIPTNPNTEYQQAVKNNMALLSQAWVQQLTDAQRTAWAAYAQNTPVVNSLGDTVVISGISMYVRCNAPRLQAGLSRIDPGPTTPGQPTVTSVDVTMVQVSGDTTVTFAAVTGSWRGVGGGLMIYLSPGLSVGKNFYKGPFRFAGVIPGAATPPTSPQEVTSPFTYAVGQRVFWRARATDPAGRLSAEFRGVLLASA